MRSMPIQTPITMAKIFAAIALHAASGGRAAMPAKARESKAYGEALAFVVWHGA